MIELLVVVAIIAILVGIVIGVAGYASRKSSSGKALAELELLKTALEEYRMAKGTYFTSTVTSNTGAAYTSFVTSLSNLVEGLKFVDPWGRNYQYQPTVNTGSPGQVFSYRLWSQGASTATTVDDVDSASGNY